MVSTITVANKIVVTKLTIRRQKDKKVGEGTYAVVYQGKKAINSSLSACEVRIFSRTERSVWEESGYQENQGWPVQRWS